MAAPAGETMDTTANQYQDYLEELSSTDYSPLASSSGSLNAPSVARAHSNSSGIGSMDSKGSRRSSTANERVYHRIVYEDPTTDLPASLPKGSVWRIMCGLVLMFLSVVTFVYTPFEVLMNERLKMIPGFPAYDWWLQPPDEVLLKVYIFNVTNGEAFLSGDASELLMEQVGPFVYREKLEHTDVVFNDNGTLTYTARRTAVYMPHLSNVSADATLVIPNLAVLGGASFLADSSFLTKMAFNMLVSRVGSSALSTISAQDYMWNWTDPLIGVARKFVPSMVPVDNMGILHRVYSDFIDRVTVYIGTQDPRRFFLIDQFRGSDRLGYWEGQRCDACQGSTEGVTYPQFLTRNDTIRYLRKTICRVAHLHYARDVKQEGMEAYRWELPHNTFHRPVNHSDDCFTLPGTAPLPNGVSDVSPCYYRFPIAISLPHFLGAAADVETRVKGLQPDDEQHGSYVIVEPLTGIPMESRARSQSNLVVKPLSGFSAEISRFSKMILPMFWLEYGQQGLPWYVSSLMYFTIIILPATQHWISLAILLAGFSLFLSAAAPYLFYATRNLRFKYHKLQKLSLTYFR